jgi:hypothetical protein
MLVEQQEAISEIGIGCLVRRGREVLSHERCIDADEMRSIERGTDGEVQFGAAAESVVEAAQSTKRLCSRHERAAS